MSEIHTVKTTPDALQAGKNAGWCDGLSKDPVEEGSIVRVITGERISLAIAEFVEQRGKLHKVLLDCGSEETLIAFIQKRVTEMPYFTGQEFSSKSVH